MNRIDKFFNKIKTTSQQLHTKYPRLKKIMKIIHITTYVLLGILLALAITLNFVKINITPSIPTGLYITYPYVNDIHRNDIVLLDSKKFSVVYAKTDKEKNIKNVLKYVRGLPNDKIEFKDYQLYINGENFGFVFDSIGKDVPRKYKNGDKFTLKENEYFVLGTSPISYDSRYIGVFKKEEFIRKGKLLFEIKDPKNEEKREKINQRLEILKEKISNGEFGDGKE